MDKRNERSGGMTVNNCLCPYCWQKLEYKKLHLFCDKCHCPFEHGLTQKMRTKVGLPIRCPLCGHEVTDENKACHWEDCGNKLPKNYMLDNVVIGLIGKTNVGKSIYITVLVERLRALAGALNLAIVPSDEHTRQTHTERVHALYADKVVLDVTQELTESPMPLIFHIQFTNSSKGIYLVFYDISGEDFENQDKYEDYLEFLRSCSGYIWLLDPALLGLEGSGSRTLLQSPDNILKGIHEFVGGDNDKPIAVCLNKMDLLSDYDALEYEQWIFKNQPYSNPFRYEEEEINKVSAIISGLLSHDIGANFVELVKQHANEFSFFGISSLGHKPESQRTDGSYGPQSIGEINPIRVEQPIFWLMKKLRMLD